MVAGRYTQSEYLGCGGRLTLSTGVPVPLLTSAPLTSSTVYYTPYVDGYIGLYTGSMWVKRNTAEITLTVPSTKFRLFDVFAYWDTSTATVKLEAVNWNQTTGSITSMTSATPVVVTANSHGRSVNDIIHMDGISTATAFNSTAYRISVINTANSFTLEDSITGAGAGTGGTWYLMNNSRATAIGFQNGIPIKSGDATRRYLGTCMTGGTSGVCEDSITKCYIWNFNNKYPHPLRVIDSSDSWTYNSTVYREARGQNNKPNRLQFVHGLYATQYAFKVSVQTNDNNQAIVGIGIDNTVTSAYQVSSQMPLSIDGLIESEIHALMTTPGFHFASWVEAATGTRTFSGDDGLTWPGTQVSAGMSGFILA